MAEIIGQYCEVTGSAEEESCQMPVRLPGSWGGRGYVQAKGSGAMLIAKQRGGVPKLLRHHERAGATSSR